MPNYITRPKKTLVEVISASKLTSGKGTVLFQDGFEGTNSKWSNISHDTTATRVFNGNNAGKITTAGAGDWTTTGSIYFPENPQVLTSKASIEWRQMIDKVATTNIASFGIYFYITGGGTQKKAGIKWVPTGAGTGKFQYYNSGGTWTDITGGDISHDPDTYYRCKLTIDKYNGKYVSFEFGTSSFDLSALSLKSAATAGQSGQIDFVAIGIDATTTDCWVDDVVVTYEEP